LSREASPRERRLIGAVLVAGSAGMGWMIHSYPEGLRAPAWVAYAAVLAFGFAGLALLAEGHRRLHRLLVPLLAACLLVPPLWIAFGAKNPQCGMSFLGVFGVSPAWACRGVFGFAALIGLLILALTLRRDS
jgi:hypothetical protein